MRKFEAPVDLLKLQKYLNTPLFIVGGAIRDMVMGRTISDIDIASGLRPDEIKDKLKNTEYKIIDTGIEFGTITIITPEGGEYEHTTFRKDISTDGRRAVVEYTDDIIDDMNRRDFTINAMAYDIVNDKIIDPFGGIEDIKNKIIRTVGNPRDRFIEDYLRIIRAIRFSIKYGFNIDINTYSAMWSMKDNIEKYVSPERIRQEIMKINNREFIIELNRFGIWNDITKYAYLIPERHSDNILIDLAIVSDIDDMDALNKYKYTNKEKKIIKMIKHILNNDLHRVYSIRNNKDIHDDIKKYMKIYCPDMMDKFDRVINIKIPKDIKGKDIPIWIDKEIEMIKNNNFNIDSPIVLWDEIYV